MNDLKAMRVFVQAVEEGSFVKAASKLRLSPSMVSLHISQLEARLGVQLFMRTTRRLNVTEDGRTYFELCRRVLNDIIETEGLLSGAQRLRGSLRINAPAVLLSRFLIPSLNDFCERYPELRLDLSGTDHVFDLARSECDIMIRWLRDELDDSPLIAKEISGLRTVVLASPGYLARYGEPRTLDELTNHHIISWVDPLTGRTDKWNFARAGERRLINLSGRLSENTGEGSVEAAVSGLGIIIFSDFLAREDIRAGRLKHILSDWEGHRVRTFLFYARNLHTSPRLRAFVDYMTEKFPRDRLLAATVEAANGRGHR